MSDGFDEVDVDTRRQLRGVAEYRSCTIRLAVRPDGVYEIVDPLPTDAALDIDVGSVDWIHRSHYAGGTRSRTSCPTSTQCSGPRTSTSQPPRTR